MAWPMLAMGGASLAMGWSSARRSRREMRRMRRVMQQQLEFAREQWQHYRDTYGDIEQQMVADAMQGVQADYAGATSRAAADVEGAFRREQEANQRQMMGLGIDPSSGRFASSDRQAGLQMAATSAMAQNQAREQERRRSEEQTFQRRAQIGQFGAGLMAGGANQVQGAMGNMAQMHQNNANQAGQAANNLFMNAGMMGMYGLDQMRNNPSDTTTQPAGQHNFNLSTLNSAGQPMNTAGNNTGGFNWGGQQSGRFNLGGMGGLDTSNYSMGY